MRIIGTIAAVLTACSVPGQAGLMLFAAYDWQDGAKDVSGSPIRHDGIVEPGASIAGGRLLLNGWDGVVLGDVLELKGAAQVLFRFEDVTFDRHGEPGAGATCHAAVLIGDDSRWAAGLFFDLPPYGRRTQLQFWLSDGPMTAGLAVTVADEVIDHFDSIEYRFDGSQPLGARLAVRWNEGPWMAGAEGSEELLRVATADNVRINNGGPADEDPMWGSIGAVWLYSNQVPEPGARCLLWSLAFAFALRCRFRRRAGGATVR